MIVLLKDIYSIGEKKNYEAGSKVSHFSKESEKVLVDDKIAEYVKAPTNKKRKTNIKTK